MFIRLDKKFVNTGSLFDIENTKIEQRSGIFSFILNEKIVIPIINIIDNKQNSYIDYYIDVNNLTSQEFIEFQKHFDLHEEQSKNNLNNVSVVKMISK